MARMNLGALDREYQVQKKEKMDKTKRLVADSIQNWQSQIKNKE